MRVTKSLRTLPCLFSKVKLVSSSVCIISLISDIHWEKIGLLIRVTCPECLVYMWYICPPAFPFSLDISSRPNPVGPSGRNIFSAFPPIYSTRHHNQHLFLALSADSTDLSQYFHVYCLSWWHNGFSESQTSKYFYVGNV